MEETLQCVSARGANDLACRLKLGVGKGNGTFLFFCFFFLMEDFTDGTPVSLGLYSVRFHQHPAMASEHECVRLHVCLCGTCNNYPCNIAFLASLSLSPLTARLLYSTQLYHFCRVEWKKGKAGIL